MVALTLGMAALSIASAPKRGALVARLLAVLPATWLVTMAANLLTRTTESFGATGPIDLARHARTVAEFDALSPTLAALQQRAAPTIPQRLKPDA